MKQINLSILLAVLLSMVGAKAFAHDIEVENADGVTIYYNYINGNTELSVTYRGSSSNSYSNEYSGNVIIPESVTYEGNVYPVTSIGRQAFGGCKSLTEVTIPNSIISIDSEAFHYCSALTSAIIPNSVTSIGYCAFEYCSSLTLVTIPNSVMYIDRNIFRACSGLEKIVVESDNSYYDSREDCNAIIETHSNELIAGCKHTQIPNSVTSIGNEAFFYCSGLTSVTIPNSVTSIGIAAFCGCSNLSEMTIPNSVTSIGREAFSSCSGLTSVTIPNSVTSIGSSAFYLCSSLKSVTIPNSVTSISERTFGYCRGLTEVYIPNSVTSIDNYAFGDCSGLTSVTVPNSVTSIGGGVFEGCSSLNEVTIGNSVKSIGGKAFEGCSGLTTLYSLNINPPAISESFTINHYVTVDVYVPKEALAAYQTANVWKEFRKLQGFGEGFGEAEKCATPTIQYVNNELIFDCETEGVTFESTITDKDIASYSSNRVKLGVTYNISVYATKTGYDDSDMATATLCWIDVEPKTEGITAISQVEAIPVLIQSASGQITVTGLDDGTMVAVYGISGQQVGTAVSTNGQTVINTNLAPGSIAIVKIGDRSIKVTVK